MIEADGTQDDPPVDPEGTEPESDKPVEPEETEAVQEDRDRDEPVPPEETQLLPFEDRPTGDTLNLSDE